MMRALLIRQPGTDHGTFGAWVLPGYRCHSIELPWRDNRPRRSCIPPGTYTCRVKRSPHCKRVFGPDWETVYRIEDVPGRSECLVHPGCLAGDIELGYDTNFEGCIGAGERLGLLRNKAGAMQRAALVSRPAVRRLMEILQGQPFTLEIRQC